MAQDQCAHGKPIISWNPAGYFTPWIAQNRINPADHLHADSPTLIADMTSFIKAFGGSSGAPSAAYFEGRRTEYVCAIGVSLCEENTTLTLLDLAAAINAMVVGGEEWIDRYAFPMSESRYPFVRRVEAEIAAAREDSSGGWRGIQGEILRSFSCLNDPALMESVSPHANGSFDFSFRQLVTPNPRTGRYVAYQVNLCPPIDLVAAWSPVLRALLMNAYVWKSRAPAAPPQTWLIDEAGNLAGGETSGGFDLLVKLYTIGAGMGIRPWCFFQSFQQSRALGKDADKIIMASAIKCFYGIRDEETALLASKLSGRSTIEYIDDTAAEQALFARDKARASLWEGTDPFMAAAEVGYQESLATMRRTMQRDMITSDEALNMGVDHMLIFADSLGGVLKAQRRNYFDMAALDRLYHPNPYVPQVDLRRVRTATRWGRRTRRVKKGAVPRRFAHLPQYQHGQWSRVK